MHRIAHLVIAFLLFPLTACSDPPAPVVEDAVLPDYSHIVCKPSVHPFWAKFRAAILKEDWEAVADMTEFPLVVIERGRKHISREEFAKQFPQLLSAAPIYGYPGVEPKPASMRALVRAVPTLAKDACGDFEEMLVLGRWEFYLRPEGWRLGAIDVDEFPASMNHIPIQPIQTIKD